MNKFNQTHQQEDYFQLAASLKGLVQKAFELSEIKIERALEVGCGQGLQLSQFEISEVLGIDISIDAIDKASKNFPDDHFLQVSSLELGDLQGLYDLILDAHHIHYLSSLNEIDNYLGQVFAKLSSGGLFCMEAMISHKEMQLNRMDVCVLDSMDYENLLMKHGFRIKYLMIPFGRKIVADSKRKAAHKSDPDVLLVIATKEDVAKSY